jgi:hypothetical protein
MDSVLSAEWRKHRSSFARKWQVSMVARKKMHYLKEQDLSQLDLNAVQLPEKQKRIMQKDIHLVKAALAVTDGVVVSLDDEAKKAFANVHLTNKIRWMNPTETMNAII